MSIECDCVSNVVLYVCHVLLLDELSQCPFAMYGNMTTQMNALFGKQGLSTMIQ